MDCFRKKTQEFLPEELAMLQPATSARNEHTKHCGPKKSCISHARRLWLSLSLQEALTWSHSPALHWSSSSRQLTDFIHTLSHPPTALTCSCTQCKQHGSIHSWKPQKGKFIMAVEGGEGHLSCLLAFNKQKQQGRNRQKHGSLEEPWKSLQRHPKGAPRLGSISSIVSSVETWTFPFDHLDKRVHFAWGGNQCSNLLQCNLSWIPLLDSRDHNPVAVHIAAKSSTQKA